jgi:hypothetical protein
MAVPSVMADLSTTANSNSPAGTESPSNADDFLRAIQAIVRTTNAKGADIASATTTDIGAATGEFVDVTGTTTITGLGTVAAGIVRTVRFTGALTLTHNATSLILPGAANITTAANDRAIFRSLGSGNWLCVAYVKASGEAVITTIANDSITAAKLADSALGPVMINGYITASVASSALTIAVKTNAGTDPSSTDPVLVLFRNSTVSNGSWSVVSITAATSVVVSNGSSLGSTASVAAKLNVLLLNNAGTAELAVCNAYGYNDLDEGNVISTTAEGGAGAADSASVIYSTTARSNVAFRYVGYLDVTPGASFAWSAAPTVIANARGSSSNNMAGMLCAPKTVTSGSSSTFSVPSWAKKIIATITGVSTNGTAAMYIRLGDAGGIENTNYDGAIATFNSASSACANISSAFNLTATSVAAGSYSGRMELTLHNPYTNTWVAEGGLSRSDSTTSFLCRGSKSLSAQVTTIELGTSDTFDGTTGEWNVYFE